MLKKTREIPVYTIDSNSNQLTITIPFKKNYYVIVLMILTWIGGIITWNDIIWILLGFPILFAVVNILFGKEVIRLNKQYLIQEFVIKKITLKSKKYNTLNIKNIRVNPGDYIDRHYRRYLEIRFWGPEMGRVSFDYGKDTIKIIGDIEEAEGIELINLIKKYLT